MTATHSADLRSGRSVWQARSAPAVQHGRLDGDTRTDVLIIGAGISGALAADALSDAGFDVVIVDRRGPVQGSTPASTALLQYEIDTPLTTLSARIGVRRAERIWRRSKLALDALRERSLALGIDADQEDRQSLYLAGNTLNARALAREAGARRRAGFEVAYLTAPDVLSAYGIRRRAALLSFGNLAADPRRLAVGFLRAAVERGARVFSPESIDRVLPDARGVRAITTEGVRIRARWVIFATGYELAKGVPRHGHDLASTWVIATRPQARRIWRDACFIWEASDPYLYVRSTADGRVICGGEDESFANEERRDALLPAKTIRLETKLARLLPEIDARAELAWCGTFGTSQTGTPSVGAVPGMPRCFAVLGFGGNGITFSMMAAQLLRAALTGTGDTDSDLFSFHRRW